MNNRLLAALFVSGILHLVIIAPSIGSPKPDTPTIHVTLAKRVAPRLENAISKTDISSTERLIERQSEKEIASTYPEAEYPEQNLVIEKKYLDAPLQILGDIDLEPTKGIPSNTYGTARLSLLIGESGDIGWIGIEESQLETSILEGIIERLRKVRYTPPRAQGKAVKTVIRMEIEVKPSVKEVPHTRI